MVRKYVRFVKLQTLWRLASELTGTQHAPRSGYLLSGARCAT